MTYAVTIFVFVALLIVLSLPAILTARSHGRRPVILWFVGGAVAVGLVIGIFDARYQRAFDLCAEAGQAQCEDIGLTGLQLLVAIGFLVTSMVMTYRIFND